MPTLITLKVFRGNELVRTEQFNREIIKIGRLASAHLCLEDDKISRIHSVIEVSPDGNISIIDMGSAEGTFVNGKKVSRGALRLGDQITLGGLRIVLEVPEGVAAPAPAAVAGPHVNEAAPEQVNRAVSIPAPAAPSPAQAARPTNGKVRAAAPPAAPAAGSAVPAVVAPATLAAPAATPASIPAAISNAAAAAGPTPARPFRAAPVPAARPKLRPAERTTEDLSSETGLGVELRILWGDTLLEAATYVRPKQPVLVGETEKCDLRLEGLPVPELPVLRFHDGDYRFTFTRGMTGAVEEKGTRVPFGELVKGRKAVSDDTIQSAYWVPVPKAGAVRAEVGARLAIEARAKRPAPVKGAPFWERINYQFLNLFLILLFLQAGFIVAANNFPYDTDIVADDLFKNPSRMAKFVIKPPEPQQKAPGQQKAEEKADPGE
ncbi:MAG TPA: FHA domain-containing protein, partial [Anaeromyxobacter sp.]